MHTSSLEPAKKRAGMVPSHF